MPDVGWTRPWMMPASPQAAAGPTTRDARRLQDFELWLCIKNDKSCQDWQREDLKRGLDHGGAWRSREGAADPRGKLSTRRTGSVEMGGAL